MSKKAITNLFRLAGRALLHQHQLKGGRYARHRIGQPPGRSRYKPHQGVQECARRRRQMAGRKLST